MAFLEHVDIVVRRDPYGHRFSDNAWVVHYHVPELKSRTVADQSIKGPPFPAAFNIGKFRSKGFLDKPRIISSRKIVTVQKIGIEMDIQLNVGLLKGGPPFSDDADKKQEQKHQAAENGCHAEPLKASLGPISPGKSGLNNVDGSYAF
jgi:hypothetical protein